MSGQREQRLARVLECRALGVGYFLLTVEAGGAPSFRAGQFAQLAVPGRVLPRPFSILRETPRGQEFLIKVVGPGSEWLAARRPGDELAVLAPLGHGWLDRLPETDDGEEWLLVGGGVGVAPLLALAEQMEAVHGRRSAILFGYRDAGQAVALASLHPGREVQLATEDGSAGMRGRVTDLLLRELERRPDHRPRVFCCGPEPMMEAVAVLCRGRGLSCHLSLETLMGCGIGICVGCAVPMAGGGYRLACQEGPVFEAGELAAPGGEAGCP
jgi:dihydroorotate dehydrogenase electron transfer subunit